MNRLTKRILRKLWYERRKREYQLHHHWPIVSTLKTFEPKDMDLAIPERCLPGNPAMLPWSHRNTAALWQDPRIEESTAQSLAHRLRIFSSEPFDLSKTKTGHSETFLRLAIELPSEVVRRYRPIHWHKDFRSGHEWSKDLWYFDRRLAPMAGADIKFPWELSRFIHVGTLAHGDYDAGGHEFILQILDWITENPRFFGVNWASELVVAGRAINWIWGLNLFRPVLERYPGVRRIIATSLYDHLIYLTRNLAYHEIYTHDHYLGDLVGILYICAAFPEFPKSDEWCLFSIHGIHSEMYRQVLVDGYSQMMSSNYHRFVTELFVSGVALAERIPTTRRARLKEKKPACAWPYVSYGSESDLGWDMESQVFSTQFYAKLQKMAHYTAVLTKPNGLVPQFGDNDSARVHRFWPYPDQDVRDHRHLLSTVGELLCDDGLLELGWPCILEGRLISGGLRVHTASGVVASVVTSGRVMFPNSQIAVLKNNQIYLAITCSPNGYQDGRGGHGHNDKLSFELNVLGEDLIVDGGCPYYTSHPDMRNAYRSTAAHNTLSVSGREQDPLPVNLFSLPQSCNPKLSLDPNGVVEGSHVGYGSPHRRRFELREREVIIEDMFVSDELRYLSFNLNHSVIAEIEGVADGKATVSLFSDNGAVVQLTATGIAGIDIENGLFGLGYGIPVGNKKIKMQIKRGVTHNAIHLSIIKV